MLKSTDSSSLSGSDLMGDDGSGFLPNWNGTGCGFCPKMDEVAAGVSFGVVEGSGACGSFGVVEGKFPKLQPVEVGGGGCGVVLCSLGSPKRPETGGAGVAFG